MKRILSILLGSVIAAAFLGPGTITAAASAGSRHGTALLWTLLFSTIACFVLQESAGRLTIASGLDLGQAIRARFASPPAGPAVLLLVLGGIVLGCAAYEAGNILGGVAGARIVIEGPRWMLTAVTAGIAGGLLWTGTTRGVSRVLGAAVAVMGLAFLVTAVRLRPDPFALVSGCLVPRLPEDSSLLALALVGTTVVPYNLFLGSGIARGQTLGDLRLGLGVAILLGGMISMGVLITGTAVPSPFRFEGLAAALRARLGPWAETCFALGLLTAGLSSAITAPLAAAVTARSLFGRARDDPGAGRRAWTEVSWRYRAVWITVLAVGAGFGIAGVRPIPAILLAQALNGVLLPFVAVFLLIVGNDASLVGARGLQGPVSNTAMGIVVAVSVVLGTRNLARAAAGALGLDSPPGAGVTLSLAAAGIVFLAIPVLRRVHEGRRRGRAAAGTAAGGIGPESCGPRGRQSG